MKLLLLLAWSCFAGDKKYQRPRYPFPVGNLEVAMPSAQALAERKKTGGCYVKKRGACGVYECIKTEPFAVKPSRLIKNSPQLRFLKTDKKNGLERHWFRRDVSGHTETIVYVNMPGDGGAGYFHHQLNSSAPRSCAPFYNDLREFYAIVDSLDPAMLAVDAAASQKKSSGNFEGEGEPKVGDGAPVLLR
jgi:hypothetical protein